MEIGNRPFRVEDESGVGEVRRYAVELARNAGFGTEDAGRVAIVATELGTNIFKHAGRGAILVALFDDETGEGVECIALDAGPGIPNLALAIPDGYSTYGSAGGGLGAIERLCHSFDVYSSPGRGVVLLARLEKGDPSRARKTIFPSSGAVSIAKEGEEICGDNWKVRRLDAGLSLLVVDGLGHGPFAADAARAAVRAYDATDGQAAVSVIERLHQATRSTRGAAASIAYLPSNDNEVVFVGVGNVAGAAISESEARRMVSSNGTLGHSLRSVRPFTYQTRGETLAILASDGLGTHWTLDAYPGLRRRHPTVVAATLYRDFNRARDDVTVLVGRRPSRDG
jgi:anti-sigma regulatory factor (Ser/Thr protein kinase)